jgi:hypothetical protein
VNKTIALVGTVGDKLTDNSARGKRQFSMKFVPRFLETVMLKFVIASLAGDTRQALQSYQV